MLLSYSPSRCDPALLRELTVGKSRETLLKTLVEAVRAELSGGTHQHQLIVGPRGSGKTHVLTLVADQLESDPEIGECVLPVPLAEEEVTAQPADLLIKILERLADRLTVPSSLEGRSRALAACRDVLDRLRSEGDDEHALALAAGALEESAQTLDRLLVPLVENLDSVLFAGYSRANAMRAQWALRKFLSEAKGLMLLATAPSLFGDVTDEGAPFYGFFRTHFLGELHPTEMLALIRRRIEVELGSGKIDDIVDRRLRTLLDDFGRRSARLRGLLVLTGGLPRFAHLLFDLLAETDVESVLDMLDRFLDTQTPYFQSRLDPRIVPKAELEILEVLATANGPLLLGEITSEVRGAVRGNVSNYLKRLRQRGLVRQRGRRQEVRYDLSEPLFRVWRRFRIGRSERERIVGLAELVTAVFEPVELQIERRDLEDSPEAMLRRDAVGYAIASQSAKSIVNCGAAYGDITDQALLDLRRREERQRELEEFREALPSDRPLRVLSSVSDATFDRFVRLVRFAENEGVRTGLIRFCVLALAEPEKLLGWLSLFEGELPASRRELLRPIRLAVEILCAREDPDLPGEPEEVRRTVAELLEKAQGESSERVERADLVNELLRALREHPAAMVMDALWETRIEIEHQKNKHFPLLGEITKTMRSCAQKADEWMLNAVRRADPAIAPVHELVDLLRKLENGSQVWHALKKTLFSKVSKDHERSIATGLEFFHDDAHVDWLEARVHCKEDFLGAAARRALFVLRPGRPPDPIDVADVHWGHYMTAPHWWLLPHLNTAPEEMTDLIEEQVAKSEDPWPVVWNLQDFASRISAETLDALLDATAKELDRELAGPVDDKGDPFWHSFRFLGRIRTPLLIKRFEERRGSKLEDDLIRWLCDRGVRFGDWGLSAKEALRILRKVGGEGITSVANCYLQKDHGKGVLRDAIELAVTRPGPRTADFLYDVAMQEVEEDSEYPFCQIAAIEALIAIDRLDLALRGAMRWALDLSLQAIALFRDCSYQEADLKPLLEALKNADSPDPGAIFAAGLTGLKEQSHAIQNALKTAPTGSELSRSCLFALWLLGEDSATVTQAFVENLAVPENEYVSWLALLDIGSPTALEALKNRLDGLRKDGLSSGDNARLITVNLLMIKETRRDVAEYLWTEIPRMRLPFVAGDQLEAFVELDREDVREWLHQLAEEGTHWDFAGSQLGAIRALAKEEPDFAFDAACRLMSQRSSHRETAPSLLLEIDSQRALPVLRQWMEEEDDTLILTTIGEAVHLAGQLPALLDWLRDPSSRLRENACIAAEVLPWTDDLAQILRERLYDETWDVRTAANRSLDQIWHAREIDRLVDEIVAETDTTRRWCLLDVALDGGHPGLSGPYSRQPWVDRLFDALPLAMRQRTVARLKERRKKLRDELKERDRSG